MIIEKDNENLILKSSIREKLIFILPLLVGIWFIIVFFNGVWNSSIIIGQAVILNPYSILVIINLILAIFAYGFFGPISFLITIGSMSSLINFKKVIVSRVGINIDYKRYLLYNKNINIKITDISEIKTKQDETSEFCQLLAISKSGESTELEHVHGLRGMNNINEIAQQIFNFLKEKFSDSLDIKLIKAEFVPFIDKEDEEQGKKEE